MPSESLSYRNLRSRPRSVHHESPNCKGSLAEEAMNDFDKTLRHPPTDPNAPPRVEPLTPPFAADVQAVFDKIMPPGVPPLTLFTTLARVPRIYDRFRAGSLLDRGPVSLRHREIVIDRTCARCGCAYEWGVHVAFFADRVALTPEQVRATVRGDANDLVWSGEESLLIRLVDELHATANISGELWSALATAFSVEQIF